MSAVAQALHPSGERTGREGALWQLQAIAHESPSTRKLATLSSLADARSGLSALPKPNRPTPIAAIQRAAVMQFDRAERERHYNRLKTNWPELVETARPILALVSGRVNDNRVQEKLREQHAHYLLNRSETLVPDTERLLEKRNDGDFSNGRYRHIKGDTGNLRAKISLLKMTLASINRLYLGDKAEKYGQVGINPDRKIINQPGYATGDQFGIAAALIDDPNLDVIISKGPARGKAGHHPTDRAESLAAFYRESGIEETRIHFAEVADLRGEGGKAMWEQSIELQEKLGPGGSKSAIRRDTLLSVSGGTDYVAEKWRPETRDRVREAWDVNGSKDEEIATWLGSKGIPATGGNVAILWSRFSGKKGDIHLEHDTSYTGMEQLAAMIAPSYSAVIIAGDPYVKPESAGKFTAIAERVGLNVYDLTGFWSVKGDRDAVLLNAWGGNTRTGQFKLYDYLDRNFEELKHLGFRSGNLEAMAMLGHNVRYLEEPGGKGGERMEAWHDQGDGRTKGGGMATGYERILVSKPPTRSGQFLRAFQEDFGDRPEWAPGRKPDRRKPHKIYDYEAGFEPPDLAKIAAYFGSGGPDAPLTASVRPGNQYSALQQLDLTGTRLDKQTIGSLVTAIKDDLLPSLCSITVDRQYQSLLEPNTDQLASREIVLNYV